MTKNLPTTSNNVKESQILAAQLLALGKTGRAVAAEVGVTEETISRWKQEKDFQIYMMELLVNAHEAARVRLQNLVDKAVTNIEAVLDDKDISAKDKFVASIKVLEICGIYNYTLSEKVRNLRHPPMFSIDH